MTETEPWWVSGVRNWLMMYSNIFQGADIVSLGYQKAVTEALKTKHPKILFQLYQDWMSSMESQRD